MNLPPPARTLNVWIVNPYGWLPGEGWRDYRNVPLADALAKQGHTVRWWLSDIEHRARVRRDARKDGTLRLPSGAFVEIVPCRNYHGNISLSRIRYERSFAAGFARRSASMEPPDVIVLAEPALFFAGPVVEYARRHDVPFILDGIDMWPELFHIVLPTPLRGMGGAIFSPFYRRRDWVIRQAAAVVAVTADYLERLTARVKPALSDVIYLGVDRSIFPEQISDRQDGAPLDAVYAGNLGDAYDMPVLLAAIDRLASAGRPIRFTLAGAGPWQDRIAALAARYPTHVRFLGRMAPDALPGLYAEAQLGLATYSAGSTVSMPTKLFDYLAAGLATVASTGGEAAQLLRDGAGRPYRAGDTDDLVAALDFYMEHPAELARVRRTARAMSARFAMNEQYDRYVAMIETVAARGRKR